MTYGKYVVILIEETVESFILRTRFEFGKEVDSKRTKMPSVFRFGG